MYLEARNRHKLVQSQQALRDYQDWDTLKDAARGAISRDSLEELNKTRSDLSGFLGRLQNQDKNLNPGLPTQVQTSVDQIDTRLRALSDKEARQKHDDAERQRFDRFLGRWTQAQLNAAEYELNQAEGHTRFRESVRQALEVYARDPDAVEAGWTLAEPLPEVLRPDEKAKVVQGCYDLLLLLSRSVVKPADGLKVLDRATLLRSEPTAAYHLRRADCLGRLGDDAGREREEGLAGRRPPVTALDHFLIGRERLIGRRWDEAIDLLEKAVQLDADLTAAHLLLAVCHYQVQPRRLEEALGSVSRCLTTHRDLAALYLLRALIQGERGNELAGMAARNPAERAAFRRRAAQAFKAAEADYGNALERHPNDDLCYAIWVNRGGMYLQAGRHADSLEDLQAAIGLRPAPYEAHLTLAQLHQKQGRLDESSRAFAQAIARAPDPAVRVALHRTRGRLHSARRDATPEQRAEALRDLEEAIRVERGDRSQVASDHVERARLFFSGGQPEATLEACAAAIRLVPAQAGAHHLRISALFALKRFDEVLGSCDTYLAREAPSVEVLEIRGLARVARRDFSGAISDYTRAIELRPDLEPAVKTRLLDRRGWAHHFAEATRLALDDFEASLALDADQAEAHAGRGFARVRLGDWKAAVADAEAAVRLLGTMPTGEGVAEARLQTRFNAARIYAQATELAAAGVGRQGERAVWLYRAYRGRALDLLRQALEDAPAPERAQLLSDPALGPLRLGRGTTVGSGSVRRPGPARSDPL
jgi:tetratricopeptide (TPR) repeat protein